MITEYPSAFGFGIGLAVFLVVQIAFPSSFSVNEKSEIGHGVRSAGLFGLFVGWFGFTIAAFNQDADNLFTAFPSVFYFLFCLFAFFLLWFVIEFRRAQGSYDQNGVRYRNLANVEKSGQWSDLVSVERNAWLGCQVLTFVDGTNIRLPLYMDGCDEVIILAKAKISLS